MRSKRLPGNIFLPPLIGNRTDKSLLFILLPKLPKVTLENSQEEMLFDQTEKNLSSISPQERNLLFYPYLKGIREIKIVNPIPITIGTKIINPLTDSIQINLNHLL